MVLSELCFVLQLFDAYFDESGNDADHPVWVVGGYLIRDNRGRTMSRKWREMLRNYKIPYFHMVDCAHGAPPFDKLDKAGRSGVAKSAIELIKKYTVYGFVVAINPNRFHLKDMQPNFDNIYDFSAMTLLKSVEFHISQFFGPSRIACFFESGNSKQASAANLIYNQLKKTMV